MLWGAHTVCGVAGEAHACRDGCTVLTGRHPSRLYGRRSGLTARCKCLIAAGVSNIVSVRVRMSSFGFRAADGSVG